MFIENNEYKILTPDGFKPFVGIEKKKKNEYLIVWLSNGHTIECSVNHKFISNGVEVFANELEFYQVIDSEDGEVVVVNDISYVGYEVDLYDIIGVSDNNLFIVDGIVSHNCDTDFVSSGDTVIDPETLIFYKDTYVQEPIEKAGIDHNLWKWEYPDYTKSYMVVADVARGDGGDYSTAQVIEVDTLTQVAEYKGKLETKDFGNFLVSLATDYNNALLVVENSNIGWATIQQIIDRGYGNLFYMSTDLKYVDVENQMTNKLYAQERGLVAGFSTTSKTRPLIISKLDDYFREKAVTVRSSRLIDELFTFIWTGQRAEAMRGYNDDLVMAFAIGLWVRDTAIRLRQQGIDLTKQALGGIQTYTYSGVYGTSNVDEDPWKMRVGDEFEDLSKWL
jgi:hypothetical protein